MVSQGLKIQKVWQIDHAQGNITVAAEIPGVCSWTVGSIEMLVIVAIGT
jgi:hypothetical protein